MKPKGFNVNGGYMGLLPNGRYQLFATEEEYLNYIKEDNENGRSNDVRKKHKVRREQTEVDR